MLPKVLGILVLLLLVSGLWWGYQDNFNFFRSLKGQSSMNSYNGPVESLNLCTSDSDLVSAPIFVAKAKDLFKKNGLDVQLSYQTAGIFCVDDVLSKKADMANVAFFGFVSKSFDNPDLRILASIAKSEKKIQMVANGELIKSPGDLKDKKIGTTKGTDAHYFLDSLLNFNGLNVSDVEIIYFKPQDLPQALIDGEVDAVMTWEPNITNAKEGLKDKALVIPGQNGQNWYWLLVTREDEIKENPDKISRFLKALIEAEGYIKSNPEESKKIVAEQVKIDLANIDSVWANYDFSILLSQDMLLGLEDGGRWAIANKLTDKIALPNYTDLIYKDALRNIKLEAVTVY